MITVVTGNAGKAKEVAAFFVGITEVEHVSLDLVEPQASTLEEIAISKVKQAYDIVQRPVIVDDTGLFIADLDGFPGVYAAYVQSTLGNKGILKLMQGSKNRTAYFETVIAYKDETEIKTFSGRVNGEIAENASGTEGFGYDPIFSVGGKKLAEMKLDEKNQLSHRSRALTAFRDWYLVRK